MEEAAIKAYANPSIFLARSPWVYSLVFFFFILCIVASSCAGEREKRKVGELRKIAESTPLFPGFQKIDEKVVLQPGKASVSYVYKSEAQFSDIEKFYDRVLRAQGWGPPQKSGPSIFDRNNANWVRYRHEDYEIFVGQDEIMSDHFEVSFNWSPI